MDGIIPELRLADKQKSIRRMAKCGNTAMKSPYLITPAAERADPISGYWPGI